jgi:hypothetical protein
MLKNELKLNEEIRGGQKMGNDTSQYFYDCSEDLHLASLMIQSNSFPKMIGI